MVSEPSPTVTMTVGSARPRLVTADQVREHIGSNSTDTDELLTRLIEEADRAVVSRYGPHSIDGPVTDVLRGGSVRLFPSQAMEGITSVTETAWDTATVLSPDDYRLWHGGRMLERLSNGSHPRADWGERVELIYTPVDTDHQRRMAIIRLVSSWAFPTQGYSQGAWVRTAPKTSTTRRSGRPSLSSSLRVCQSNVHERFPRAHQAVSPGPSGVAGQGRVD